jgi:hypothetical protein
MKTYKITKSDLDADNFYKGASNFDGHVEADENLELVKFKSSFTALGYIYFKAGSGIEAGEGIEAGWGIKAGEGIEAGWGIEAGLGIEAGSGIKAGEGIEAGLGIEAGSGIKAGEGIEAGGGIEAGLGIEAGSGIKAGWGIEAGEGIKAGEGIEAGGGIEAGLSIICKTISAKFRIFAGLCIWKLPEQNETEIKTEELISGTIAFGNLVITQKVNKVETIRIGNLEFDKAEVERLLMGLKPVKG